MQQSTTTKESPETRSNFPQYGKLKPFHLSLEPEDLEGNGGRGRFVFLPGSDGRAKELAASFSSCTVKSHSRAHNGYLGELQLDGKSLDVCAISTGMGAGSIEIILNELFSLGARNFLRLGTAGSLQPSTLKIGTMVAASGAVKDEGSSSHYVPQELPALASIEFLRAIAALEKTHGLRTGLVHSKSTLYGREFGFGARAGAHTAYLDMLSQSGVLASEMETSMLYTLGQLFAREARLKQEQHPVFFGSILAVIGDDSPFGSEKKKIEAVNALVNIGQKLAIDYMG